MRYKEHFSPQMRTQMTDVWKEVFNLFTDLRDDKYAYVDEQGYEWHNIKLDEYRFINIVKTLYEKLNTPNSRCLVKDFHDQLSPASISKNRFCLEKDNQILCYAESRITEYERNIIFGGLYYVLYKQQESLQEPTVVEKVKQIVCRKGIPYLHYFYYFEEALLGKPTISSQPAEKPVGRSVKEYDQLFEICTQLENYKLWIEDTLSTQGQYFPDQVKQELHDLKQCLDVCQKSLPLGGLKPQVCGATIVVPKGTSPKTIETYIKEKFAEKYATWKQEKENTDKNNLSVEDKREELPPLFRLDSHSASVIETKIKEKVNIKSKTQACANLYGLQREGYINLDQYSSDEERAKVLNQHQDRHIFSEDDVQRGRSKPYN